MEPYNAIEIMRRLRISFEGGEWDAVPRKDLLEMLNHMEASVEACREVLQESSKL